MSIQVRIRELEAAGALVRYEPAIRQPLKRRLWLSEEALKDLSDPNSAINALRLGGYVRAQMTHWVTGGRVRMGMNRKARFLCRLDPPPPEIWELRVTDPDIQVRLFCRFAEPDSLIGTKMHTRRLLGNKGSQAWSQAMKTTEETWKKLFPNHAPLSGHKIGDYVTENYDEFKI